MCFHSNPITNVTTKTKISQKIKAIKIRPRKKLVEDNRSFMEMSLYRIKKYFKNEAENHA